MPYAFVQDVSASWHVYEQVRAALVDETPHGLILHLAGPTDEGVRIIGVWTNQQAWEAFRVEQMAPALASLGGLPRPNETFRELRPRHFVVGDSASRPEAFDEEEQR